MHGNFLFVYGTLLPARCPAGMRQAVDQLKTLGRGTVRGRLFDLGAYPAAILDDDGEGLVHGTVVAIPDAATLALLDQYEGFNPRRPAQCLFLRTHCRVALDDGRQVQCWVYVYNRDVRTARPIPGGDYCRGSTA